MVNNCYFLTLTVWIISVFVECSWFLSVLINIYDIFPVRLSGSPEADSDAPLWRSHIQPEELLQTMESSTSTDSSLIEGKTAGLLITSEITGFPTPTQHI